MSNTTLSADIIANEALMILENNLIMANLVHRAYENEFDKRVNGYEIGETITIRRPNQFTVRTGAVAAVQDVTEGKTTLTVNTQKGIDFKFSSADLTLKISDLGERVMKPALVRLADEIDRDVMALYKLVPNWVGTPGQVVNSFADFAKGPERLDHFAVPTDMRSAVLSPADHWGMLGSFTGLFIQDTAKTALQRAKLPDIGGVTPYMAQNVPAHTNGAGGATGSAEGLVNGANQNITYASVKDSPTWSQNLVTDDWDASETIRAGDVFTIANVFAVNPVNKATLDLLQQFVVVEDVTASGGGAATLKISPPIITSGPFQTVSAAPADDAQLTRVGAESTAYRQNMVFHKNAFALVMVPMVKPPGAVDVARKSHKGISVRVIPYYDGTNDQSSWRLDVLYGVKALDPKLAVRLSGTA
jgi:hypothetical protein